MKTRTKVWLIIAASLVLLGCILFAGVMATLKWDLTALATVKYETNTYEISEGFDSISIHTDTAQILLAVSHDGKCRVVCHEEEKARHTVTVENGTLTAKLTDERSVHDFFGHIGINTDFPRITVYLPRTDYRTLTIRGSTCDVEIPSTFTFRDADISLSTGSVDFSASASGMLRIQTTTGYIRTEHITAGALDLSVSTGNVTVSDVACQGDVTVAVTTGKTALTDLSCKNLISGGSTGDITLRNVIASEAFSITRSTGDVVFDGCDAAEIYVKTDTGDVSGSLLTAKVFLTQTDTGDVDVPKTATGGKCQIITDTGDIHIHIP